MAVKIRQRYKDTLSVLSDIAPATATQVETEMRKRKLLKGARPKVVNRRFTRLVQMNLVRKVKLQKSGNRGCPAWLYEPR